MAIKYQTVIKYTEFFIQGAFKNTKIAIFGMHTIWQDSSQSVIPGSRKNAFFGVMTTSPHRQA
jgi:hypothetical protein